MGFLKDVAKWVDKIYQIEENDPVHGGENGITNRPARELADRTQFLKNAVESIIRSINERIPNSKKSDAVNSSSSDTVATSKAVKTAYDLANAKYTAVDATTARKGIVQLNDTLTSTATDQALTAAQGKVLKGQIDSNARALNERIPNSKKSDAVNSSSSDTVATSKAVKTAYDLASEAVHQYKTLPAGDVDTFAYWHRVPAGRYWATPSTGLTNAKTTYAHIDVLKASTSRNEYCVIWYGHNGQIHRAHINQTSIKWYWLNQPATTEQVGMVQLNNEINNPITTQAATANAVKRVNDKVESISVGGRNYFKKSTVINKQSSEGSFSHNDQNGVTFNPNTEQKRYFRLRNVITNTGSWVVSAYIKSSEPNSVLAIDVNDDGAIVDQGANRFTKFTIGTDYQRVIAVIHTTKFNKTYHFVDFTTFTNATFIVKDLKVEQGTIPTDWTPAPEDLLPITGGTVTGNLQVNGVLQTNNTPVVNNPRAWQAIKKIINGGSWFIEFPPDNTQKRFNVYQQLDDSTRTNIAFPDATGGKVVAYRDWVESQARNYVLKSGDTMNGSLYIKGHHPRQHTHGIKLVNTGGGQGSSSHLDFFSGQETVPQAGIHFNERQNNGVSATILTTPEGDNRGQDRRIEHTIFAQNGEIHNKVYGWLHDYFAKQADNNNIWEQLNNHVMKKSAFHRSWYPNHYAGAEVYKIGHLGLMITVMNTTGANGTFYLPEAYDGHGICLAQDIGGGGVSLAGSHFSGGNQIFLAGRNDTHCHVLVIGMKNI